MADNWRVHVATLRHPDQASRTRLEAALRALLETSKQDESSRPQMAQGGALAPLIAVAARTGEYWVGIRQLCLQVLATISWHADTGLQLVEAGMLPIAINALEDEDEVTVGRAIGILNNIAMYEKARKQMLASGVLEAIKPFLGSPALLGLDADKIVAYLVGKEDAKEHELMVAGEGSIERLVSAARDTLQGNQVCGLKLSVMGLLKAVRLIAINDNNKTRLVNAGAVEVLMMAAAKRREHAHLSVGALLELSFDDKGLAELRKLQQANRANILSTLSNPGEDGASDEVRRDCCDLLFMLKGQPVKAAGQASAASVKKKHMMVSYAWAQKKRVQRLCKELRRGGVDVWRDEDGSSVVPPMSANTADCMAQALEAASVVLVCVSREYKDSGNCRMECKYAKALEAAGKLKIIYLMMEEDFTTMSDPPIGGWLRLYMEDALWYPCWDDDAVEDAGSKVAAVLEELQGQAPLARDSTRDPEDTTVQKSSGTPALTPEVVKWLADHDLASLQQAFVEHELFTLRTVAKMQPQDIDLATAVVGRRIKLRDAIQALRSRKPTAARPAATPRPLTPSNTPRAGIGGYTGGRAGLDISSLLQGGLL